MDRRHTGTTVNDQARVPPPTYPPTPQPATAITPPVPMDDIQPTKTSRTLPLSHEIVSHMEIPPVPVKKRHTREDQAIALADQARMALENKQRRHTKAMENTAGQQKQQQQTRPILVPSQVPPDAMPIKAVTRTIPTPRVTTLPAPDKIPAPPKKVTVQVPSSAKAP